MFFVLGEVAGVPLGESGSAVSADEEEAVDHLLSNIINTKPTDMVLHQQ